MELITRFPLSMTIGLEGWEYRTLLDYTKPFEPRGKEAFELFGNDPRFEGATLDYMVNVMRQTYLSFQRVLPSEGYSFSIVARVKLTEEQIFVLGNLFYFSSPSEEVIGMSSLFWLAVELQTAPSEVDRTSRQPVYRRVRDPKDQKRDKLRFPGRPPISLYEQNLPKVFPHLLSSSLNELV